MSYFDGNGNYMFKPRVSNNPSINITNGASRSWGTGMVENFIEANLRKDISRVKNAIRVTGSVGSSGASYFIDTKSQQIYGTRNYDYNNEFLVTSAACQVIGSMLLDTLKVSKPIVDCIIPFHPELSVLDEVDFYDYDNNKKSSGLSVRNVSHNLNTFTTRLNLEGYKSEEY
jgi:hypothetical protein